MSLKARLVALEKRRSTGFFERIRLMSQEEIQATVWAMFAKMEKNAAPVHAAHIRAAAVWFMNEGGCQHPESMRIMMEAVKGPLDEKDLKTINFNTQKETAA